MPSATMREEDKYKLPADTLFSATLLSVKEVTIPYTKDGEERTFTKWTWEFEITGGQYEGLHAWGDTEDRLTNHPDNRVRQWAETLRGAGFEIGEGLETDDLLGLPCRITVENKEHVKKNGDKSYLCPVVDVFPASGDDDEPPF